MKKKVIPVLVVLALILIMGIVIVISNLVKKYTPTSERKDLNEYFHIISEEQPPILVDNTLTDSYSQIINGQIYIDFQFLHDHINSRFYWDSNENVLLYTTATDVIRAESDSNTYSVSKSSNDFGYTIVKASADSAWVALDFVKQYSNIAYEIFENPKRLVIQTDWSEKDIVTTTKNTEIRERGGIKSLILSDIEEEQTLYLLDQGEDWHHVATKDGFVGYVPTKHLSDITTETPTNDFEEEAFRHITKDKDICMAWHQVTDYEANRDIASVLGSTKGVTVISPTWFALKDNKGNLSDMASSDYVNYCHEHNVEVWALVSNLVNYDVDTSSVLTHTSLRQNLINQIVSLAIQYNLDGINLDFEELDYNEVGDSYIQFVRELSLKLRNNDIIFSVDNYVPSKYTAFYNRKEQANFADYIVIMGYDEHYGGSSQEGSVSSLGWVKEAVTNTMAEVPANQIILGMPFYTRLWTLTPKDTESESEKVEYSVSSEAYGMSGSWNLAKDHGADITWLEDFGQYYAEYSVGDTFYKIWLEDAKSTECRMKVMDEQNLAGAAFWKLGLETGDIWDTIIKYLN